MPRSGVLLEHALFVSFAATIPDMILKTNCPHCSQPVEYEAQDAGETIQCPSSSCGQPFQLPAKKQNAKSNKWQATGSRLTGLMLCLVALLLIAAGAVTVLDRSTPGIICAAWFCSGFVILGLSALISISTRILEELKNRD